VTATETIGWLFPQVLSSC